MCWGLRDGPGRPVGGGLWGACPSGTCCACTSGVSLPDGASPPPLAAPRGQAGPRWGNGAAVSPQRGCCLGHGWAGPPRGGGPGCCGTRCRGGERYALVRTRPASGSPRRTRPGARGAVRCCPRRPERRLPRLRVACAVRRPSLGEAVASTEGAGVRASLPCRGRPAGHGELGSRPPCSPPRAVSPTTAGRGGSGSVQFLRLMPPVLPQRPVSLFSVSAVQAPSPAPGWAPRSGEPPCSQARPCRPWGQRSGGRSGANAGSLGCPRGRAGI